MTPATEITNRTTTTKMTMRQQQQHQQSSSSSRHKLTLIVSSFIITYGISFGTELKLHRSPHPSFGNNSPHHHPPSSSRYHSSSFRSLRPWPDENDYHYSRLRRCRRDISSFHHVRHAKTSLSFSHSSSSSSPSSSSSSYPFSSSPPQPQSRPFPGIPSRNFITLAESQFELLAHSLLLDHPPPTTPNNKSKIKSMALYLPRENPLTGQLEFVPTMIYPSPLTERIFIASAAESGLPPTIPKTLGKLQGFTHASGLMPTYPFLGGDGGGGGVGVGGVEEMEGGVVSVPLCHGAVTVGVLLIWPTLPTSPSWTARDVAQISRAAYSLSLALSMDISSSSSSNNAPASSSSSTSSNQNVISTADQTEQLRHALSENLHQVKNPLQALRTFGKLLQRKLALEEFLDDDESSLWEETDASGGGGGLAYLRNENVGRNTAIILSLANSMMVQSERVLDLLSPMDDLVRELEGQQQQQQQLGGIGDADGVTTMMMRREMERRSDDDEPFSSPAAAASLPFGANDTNGMAGVDNFFFLSGSSSSPSSSNDTAALERRDANVSFDSFQTTTTNGLYLPLNDTTTHYNQPRPPPPPSSPPSSSSSSSSFTSLYLKNVATEIGFVPDVVSPLLAAFRVIAADRNISFRVYGISDDDNLPGVTLCPKALREALSNVLDNAFKYVTLTRRRRRRRRRPDDDDSSHPYDTPLVPNDDPLVTIRVSSNPPPHPAGVSIVVSDNGPGIPPDDRRRIFERGWRAESTKRLVEGTGIGLDVSRGLMEGMGGRLDVLEEEEEEGGTRMRLMLFRSWGGRK